MKAGEAQVGVTQIDSIEPGLTQICPLQFGTTEIGIAQIRVHEIHVGQLALRTAFVLQELDQFFVGLGLRREDPWTQQSGQENQALLEIGHQDSGGWLAAPSFACSVKRRNRLLRRSPMLMLRAGRQDASIRVNAPWLAPFLPTAATSAMKPGVSALIPGGCWMPVRRWCHSSRREC